ncbi:hypothetical protein [Nonomuraea sp. NPDC049695]|uniref:hypothetical protein n=1 Tax=Nonomuraea sp. NPDC049695 TaxID=3154734 RepID=UPI00344118B8
MTRLAQSALAALAMAMLAVLLLSHGAPSAGEPYASAAPVAVGETRHCEHFPQLEEPFSHVWSRDRQQTGRALGAKSSSGAVTTLPVVPAITVTTEAEDPPYGLRRQRSGALPAVFQVFRC